MRNDELRKAVWEKTAGHCHMCGGKLVLGEKKVRWRIFNRGHVVANKNGGKMHLSNLLPICAFCNKKRGHLSPKDLRKMFKLGRKAMLE